ncbi:PREDICTED: copine-9-like isoform X2 [Amphimedon queenslandica]|uniref:Copine-3 n=1 Tax=Amphimedon queenslandica TaxID=400682 RepID=A0AAN0J637_AMPQE|nr:PREDICTED: copine-9-like isoform X2 [Amphimedon queenslandica]|eukprot:XP_019852495.1 PREDICTED: copine-9-like isoform X2 [Amphimedon queenslandica]
MSDVYSKVELSIECTNLKDLDTFSKSDPAVFLFQKKGREWIKLGRTELIENNLNPKFATTFTLKYHFEEIQDLKFIVYDIDDKKHIDNPKNQDIIGEMTCTLADIVAAGQRYERKLRHKGEPRGGIRITVEEVQDSKFDVTLQLSASKLDKKDFFGKSDPFFVISKVQEGGEFTVVYRSNPIMKTLNPKWPRFTIGSQKLCSGDWDRTLKITVSDWNSDGSEDLIGEALFSLKDITKRGGSVSQVELINPELKKKKSKYTNSGVIHFGSVCTTPVHSFMDYIKGGCQVSLMVAIDFTASNGKPTNPTSLHYNDPQRDNEYVTAIKSVASVLVPYDTDQMFPVFGFGAKFRQNGEVSHCFPLNFNPQNPEVYGLEGILGSYWYALSMVDLHGPTNFSSFLDTAKKYASTGVTQERQQYYILLVITDGEITDMQNTIDRIVAASTLPLSIVIVGVGGANFSKMEILDADDNPLVDKYNKKMERDIVQFVPLREYQSRAGANFSLAKETLAEIPGQLLSFMRSKGIKPNPPPLRAQQSFREGGPGQAPYPSGGPGQAPYPTGGPGQAPYPTGGPGQAPYPTGGPGQAPYPTGGPGQAPYPTGGPGQAPYPTGGPGQAPYPTGGPGQAPYPTGGPGQAPYPTGGPGQAPYPTGGPGQAPYPTGGPGKAPYPTVGPGQAPYPTGGPGQAPYPTGGPGQASN